MTGSPTLDLDQSIQTMIIEHLTERAPTISARRATRLCQTHGYEIDHQNVTEALDQLAVAGKVTLVRKGVYRLSKSQEPSSSSSSVQSNSLTLKPSSDSNAVLSEYELRYLRQSLGKTAPSQAKLSRNDLENAQRIASFLSPYPSAPVDLSDVLATEEALGKARAKEALWIHLQAEADVVCELYQAPRTHLQEPVISKKVEDHPPKVTSNQKKQEKFTDQPNINLTKLSNFNNIPKSHDAHQLLLTQALFELLKKSQCSMSLAQVKEFIDLHLKEPQFSLDDLSQQVISLNQEAESRGQRPPFSFDDDGNLGLSEWGVTSSMRASEGRLTRELQVYHEQLYVELSARLRALDAQAFTHLLNILLQKLGYAHIESLNSSPQEGVALMAQHPEWGDSLVLAQRSKKALSSGKIKEVVRSLSTLRVDRALLISLSGFTEYTDSLPEEIELICERKLIELFITQQIGVSQYTVPLSYINIGFFDQLKEKEATKLRQTQLEGGK